MDQFTHYAMPIYTPDQATYFRQLYEWHLKMNQYQEQLRTYHLESAMHFQRLAEERAKERLKAISAVKIDLMTWSDFIN
jgi:hypothetical protein